MNELVYEPLSRPRRPKGTIARARARKRRKEAPVVNVVRAACVERDGYCRFMGLDSCRGWSEWAHLEEKQRFKTRGQAPEVRHTTAGSAMLCEGHHDAYDDGEIAVRALSPDGADGDLEVRRGDQTVIL